MAYNDNSINRDVILTMPLAHTEQNPNIRGRAVPIMRFCGI